ncbi:sporulation protein YpjB [Cohnella terricola]|uniref:Sporulation protein YpjB n=1 Tax=Cohnella terricola TaxID=1289167 RepID=A0A559JXP9_9BACL|nr:sporulation protein YpjB [Cohnella terricola]TVY04590.1 hypothetical protein FPZ45_03200 [Cohnella terricola]
MLSFMTSPWRMRKLRIAGAALIAVLGLIVIAPSTGRGLAFAEASATGPEKLAPAAGRPYQLAYDRFLSTAEALYEDVNAGLMRSASQRLTDIEEQFRNLSMKEIATAEGIHALAQTITELKRTSAAVKRDITKWKSGAAALRLAADALAHPDKPIWHRYRTVLQEDLAKIGQALPKQTSVSGPAPRTAVAAFDQLSSHYSVIRTAALLRNEPWIIERSDSVLRYASRIYRAESPKGELLQSTVEPLKEAINGLFPSNKEASTAVVPPVGVVPPSWGWSAMMGSFIVTILTWVGWRRYKYEEYSGKSDSYGKPDESKDAARQWLNKWTRKK